MSLQAKNLILAAAATAALAGTPALGLAQTPPPGPYSYPGGVPRYQRNQASAPAAQPPTPRLAPSTPEALLNGLVSTTPLAINIRGVADVHSALNDNQVQALMRTLNYDPRVRRIAGQWTPRFFNAGMITGDRFVVGYQNGIAFTTGR
jgi:hypothetical protein